MRKDSSYKALQTLLGLASLGLVAWFLVIVYQATAPDGNPLESLLGADAPATPATAPVTGPATATSCGEADLDNTVTVVDAYRPASGEALRRCLSDGDIDEAVLRFLPRCHQTAREALKVEKFLSQAAEPLASDRAPEYCNWIRQGMQNGCPANSALYCYLDVCQKLLEQQAEASE